MIKKLVLIGSIFLLLLLVDIRNGYSQCDPLVDPFCDDPDTPLDAGVVFLLGAGALYGIKKIKESKEVLFK